MPGYLVEVRIVREGKKNGGRKRGGGGGEISRNNVRDLVEREYAKALENETAPFFFR